MIDIDGQNVGLRSCTRTEESFALKMMREGNRGRIINASDIISCNVIEAHRERWSVFSDFLVANAKEPQRAEMSSSESMHRSFGIN